MTNLEGRVILRRRAMVPPAGVRTDLEVLASLAEALDKRHFFLSSAPRDVFAELGRASAGGPADYSGITYEHIESEDGVFWPCPSTDHPGTPRLFADGFPTPSGRARFHAVSHQAPADERNETHPLYLTTGRVLKGRGTSLLPATAWRQRADTQALFRRYSSPCVARLIRPRIPRD